MKSTIDVVIPLNHPNKRLEYVLYQLSQQTVPIHEIILVMAKNTVWDKSEIIFPETVSIREITLSETSDKALFWNTGIKASSAEFILMLSEDAIPCDENLIKILLSDFEDEKMSLVYGRQLPGTELTKREKAMQAYLYPATSKKKSLERFSKLGLNLFFCSNHCAMYRRRALDEQGLFLMDLLTQPEMIWAADALYAGKKIHYESRARVQHSISNGVWTAFGRMFDLGVLCKSQSSILGMPLESVRYELKIRANSRMLRLMEIIENVLAKIGIKKNMMIGNLEARFTNNQTDIQLEAQMRHVNRIIREQTTFSYKYLLKNEGANECIPLFATGILMLVGWAMGGWYQHLPTWFCRLCSQNKDYWK